MVSKLLQPLLSTRRCPREEDGDQDPVEVTGRSFSGDELLDRVDQRIRIAEKPQVSSPSSSINLASGDQASDKTRLLDGLELVVQAVQQQRLDTNRSQHRLSVRGEIDAMEGDRPTRARRELLPGGVPLQRGCVDP